MVHLAVSGEFRFATFMQALLRRLSALVRFHCGGSVPEDVAGLLTRARQVQVTPDVRW